MLDAPKSFKKGYKFRVYPTPEQIEPLAQAFGSARFVYNTLLARTTGHHLGRKLKLSERNWHCPHCGHNHDRDVNAAQVIAKEAELHSDYHGLLKQPHRGTFTHAGKRDAELYPFWTTPTGQSVSAC